MWQDNFENLVIINTNIIISIMGSKQHNTMGTVLCYSDPVMDEDLTNTMG